jgi:hypothetical protein
MLSRPVRRSGAPIISQYRVAALSITSVCVLAALTVGHAASAQTSGQGGATGTTTTTPQQASPPASAQGGATGTTTTTTTTPQQASPSTSAGAASSATTQSPASSEGTLAIGARLSGFQETPSIFTPGNGTFDAAIDLASQELSYTLAYTGLSTSVTVAHIHFAKKGVAGGILAFLCGGGNKPPCPPSGPVTGTIAASDVMAIAEQGVPEGSFQALFQAVASGSAYANVHTSANPQGEIRGQIQF